MVDIRVDYDFYVDSYGGDAIPSELFDKYINDSYLKIMQRIRNNLYDLEEEETEIIENVKKCQCELADFIYKYGINSQDNETSQSAFGIGEVKSESAGSVSRTYVTNSEIYATRNQDILNNSIKYEDDIIYKYLGYTGLLYVGLG